MKSNLKKNEVEISPAMKIPIICVHNGKHRYLYYVLKQAKLFNEEVILLGDNVSSYCKKISNYYPLEQFSGSILQKQFSSLYCHLSTNDEEFEIACFLRWFQILEYMRQNKFECIIHIDSDNLIYENLMNTIEKNIGLHDAGYNIAKQEYEDMVWAASPHISFWKYNKLQEFCLFIINQYKNGRNELMKKWNRVKIRKLPGGISDMTLLYIYYLKNKDSIANLLIPTDDQFYIDQNINIAQNFNELEFRLREIRKGISLKDVRIRNGIPFCFNENKKSEIEFVSLHFQGFAKNFIYLFISWKPGFPERIMNSLLFRIHLYKKRLRNLINKST